jgi:hypothetical protein
VSGYVRGFIEEDFRELYSQEVILEVAIERDRYGKPVYGPPVPYHAHIEGLVQQVTTMAGVTVTSTQTVYLFGAPVPTPDSRITLPRNRRYSVLSFAINSDERGEHDTVIFV